MFNSLVALSREMGGPRGYTEVKTPQLYDSSLWKTSGHWDKYREHMFLTESADTPMGLKPMNCPGHCQLYSMQPHSYRDLPIRYSEPGLLHRNELSGALHGLLRTRNFAQDDGHVFCTEDQVQDELEACLDFAFDTYAVFGFDVRLELSTRPDERLGSDELWDRAESHLIQVLDRKGLDVRHQPGRRLLLRPQDRPAHDRFARTLVADRDRAARLQHAGAVRAHLHGRRQRRASAGDDPSRPDGVLRAVHRDPDRALRRRAAGLAGAGAGDRAADRRPASRLRPDASATSCDAGGVRAELDERTESVGRKIRDAELRKIPYMLVVGDREQEAKQVAVREHRRGDEGSVPVERVHRAGNASLLKVA